MVRIRLEHFKKGKPASEMHHVPSQWQPVPTASVVKAPLAHVVVAVRGQARQREAQALALALRMAKVHQARVTLLHVLEPTVTHSIHWLDAIDNLHHALSAPGQNSAAMIDKDRCDKARSDLDAFLERESPRELRGGVNMCCECRIGDVATEIARFAETQSADLVLLCNCPSAWRPWPWPELSRRIASLLPKMVVLAHARM